MGGVRKSGAAPDTSCGEGAAPHLRLVGTSQSAGFRWKGFLLGPLSPSLTLFPGRCSSQL